MGKDGAVEAPRAALLDLGDVGLFRLDAKVHPQTAAAPFVHVLLSAEVVGWGGGKRDARDRWGPRLWRFADALATGRGLSVALDQCLHAPVNAVQAVDEVG